MNVEAPVFISWGEILWDHFPDRVILGGAPSNLAYHLAALGAKVALVSRVGDDEAGHRAIARLEEVGVDTYLVQIDPTLETGRVDVTLMDGEPSYSMNPGGAWEHVELSGDARSLLANAKAVTFGTLSQHRDPSSLFEALDLVTGLRICDPNLRPYNINKSLVYETLGRADVVKINESEKAVIEETFATADAVAYLFERGVKVVALTRGGDGSELLYSDGRRAEGTPVPASGGDHVGAGDSFAAVLSFGLVQDWPPERILQAANRYASFVASSHGATPAIPAELLESISST